MRIPMKTLVFKMSIASMPTASAYALKSARPVSAADPIANPLPIAAVVFPTASRVSVISRTFGSWWDISAIPPALSATGPYASTAREIPRVESIPTAAIPIPYIPAKLYAMKIAMEMIKTGQMVDSIPLAKPLIMSVAAPV